jgi:aldose 1-epimerase
MRTPTGRLLLGLTGALLVSGCAPVGPHAGSGPLVAPGGARVDRQPFGTTAEGQPAELFTLTNANGMEVRLTNYGGVITSIRVPDRDGHFVNVVPGYETLAEYLTRANFSSIVGRFANRIGGARFTIDGREYRLPANNGPNHIHGGPNGFARQVWSAEPFLNERGVGVALRYTSLDGEEGFPGTLGTRATFTLTERDELVIDYAATTDRPTHVNLTHHVYFNLTGDQQREIFDHELMVNASRITEVDSLLIPTGRLASVLGTPFDFTRPTRIGSRLGQENQQLRFGRNTYDHNFVLNRTIPEPTLAARLRDPESGRVLEVLTTEPGIQVYTGRRTGVALETQHFPDSPNKPHFPSTLLRPGQEFRSVTIFRFSAP